MTLSASAIINGLTLLRAYNPEIRVHADGERMAVASDGFLHPENLHTEDYRRLESEGWHWNDGCQEWWLT